MLWAVVVWVGIGTAKAAELTWTGGLVNDDAGNEVQIVTVDGSPFELEKRGDAGATPSWRLTGDHPFLDTQARWSPNYSLVRMAATEQAGGREQWVGRVSVWRTVAPAEEEKTERGTDTLDEFLAVRRDEDAVAVVVWLEAGRPVLAECVSLPASKDLSRFSQVIFNLSESGLSRAGQPVVMLWQKGGFLAAKPRFADEEAQRVFIAAMRNDETELGRLLEKRSLAKQKDEDGFTPLHFAAEAGAEAAVARLLAAGAAVNARAANEETPLHWAAAKGRTAIFEQLLAAKALPDQLNKNGRNPLMDACAHGHSDVVFRLLKLKSVDVGRVNNSGDSAATLALNAGNADILRALLERKRGLLNFAEVQMTRVLATQIAQGRTDVVRLMLENKTRVNDVARGRTPLMAAAARGSLPMVELLIAAGADVELAGEGGVTPLMLASRKGSVEVVARLLAAGASAKAKSKLGMTALHEAILGDTLETARILIDAGAPLAGTQDGKAPEPLALALIVNARAVLPMLEERGARLDWRRPGADYAVFLVLAGDRETLLKRALEDGWPAATNLSGWTAAGLAKFYGAARCVAVLSEAGVRVDEADLPTPVAAKELDALPRPVRGRAPVDSRGFNEDFPETKVSVDFILSPQGAVLFPRVVEAPDARLALAALDAVEGWQFSPPKKGGQPVTGRFLLPLVFGSSRERAFDLAMVDVPPKVVKTVPLDYPLELQFSGVVGHVVVTAEVTPEGKVENVRAIESTNPLLDAEAVRAFKKWRFTPAMRDGEPVRVRVSQKVVFKLAP